MTPRAVLTVVGLLAFANAFAVTTLAYLLGIALHPLLALLYGIIGLIFEGAMAERIRRQ